MRHVEGPICLFALAMGTNETRSGMEASAAYYNETIRIPYVYAIMNGILDA